MQQKPPLPSYPPWDPLTAAVPRSSRKPTEPRYYYFAYGSNWWLEQMRYRCPQFTYVGRGVLRNHEWIIDTRGYATVYPLTGDDDSEGSEESSVGENEGRKEWGKGADKHRDTNGCSTKDTYGVVYTLTKSDMDNLDYYEGTDLIPEPSYLKVTLDIHMLPPLPGVTTVTNAPSLPCLVYIGTHTYPGKVREEYIGRINRGLRDARLPPTWVHRVIRNWITAGVGVEEEDNIDGKKRGLSKARARGKKKVAKHWEPADAFKE